MWKSIFLLLLLQVMASVVQAEQQALSLTLNSNTDENRLFDIQANQGPQRDCSNLGYEVTFLAPAVMKMLHAYGVRQ